MRRAARSTGPDARHVPRRPVWTQDRIIDALRSWHNDHDRVPSPRDWTRATTEHPHTSAVYKRFGSWLAALEAAGLPTTIMRWTDTLIIAAMRDWAREHGQPPTANDWATARAATHPNTSTVIERFGSWNNGLAAAGFQIRLRGGRYVAGHQVAGIQIPAGEQRRLMWTDEAMIEAIVTAAKLADRPLTRDIYRRFAQGRDDMPAVSTVLRRIGPWPIVLAVALRRAVR